jgi:hypothetical protein
MTGKISIMVQVSQSDSEILKTLHEHCFIVADIKAIIDNNLLLEIEAFTNLEKEDAF